MRKLILSAAALLATTAMAAGPIIWNGANSRDLTANGLLTPRLTLPENSVVTSADQIIVRAPASITAPWTLTLPPDDGTANYVMITDGSGNTSWVDAQTVVQGSANTFAGYNATGDLTSVPGWTYDPSNFSGVVVDNIIVPVTGTSGTLNTYRTVVDPAATVTNTQWIQTQHEMNIGSGNGAAMDDVLGFQVNVNSREDSDVDTISLLQANADIGANDAITVTQVNGIQSSIDIDDQATVTNIVGITNNTNSDAGSQITSLTQTQIGGTIDTVTGGYAGINTTPTITAVNNVNGYFLGGTYTTVGSNFTGFSASPTVTNPMTSSYSGFTNAPNLGETNGAQAFSDFAQVDDNPTNSYQSMLSSPTVTAANAYTSFSSAPTLGTIENAYGLSDGPNVTSVENYTSANLGGNFALVTDNYKGINISPTAAGDGSGSAVGLNINMAGATNFSAGQVYAIQATGNADIQGRFNAFSAYTPVNGGGNPGSVHGLVSAIGVPDNATIANVDTMGVNTASLISLGSNSTITSGPFGLGITALAFPAVLTMETGASADYVNGAVFALSLDAANTGGTVDTVNLARATAIPQGGTQTITELRGYYTHLPFGDPGTTSWGLYSEDFPQNFMEGNLRLGGTPGSSDTTTARLQVQGNALLQNASGSQPQMILSEDPDNGTNATAIQAAATLASDYTLTLPADDGASGQVLATDGSGNTSWTDVPAAYPESWIANWRAEESTIVGMTTYDDGASATPVDCTGGAPSTLTLTRNTTNPMSETADFHLAKSAADGQGEGLAIDVTLPTNNPAATAGWNAQLAAIFRTVSGTYASGDIGVYVYDVTNATTPVKIDDVANSSQSFPWDRNFSTSGTSASYRVCMHVQTTSASAYTLAFDNVYAGIERNGPVSAMPYEDSVAWTPTGSWVTNTTYTGFYWRRGNLFNAEIKVALSGAPTVANLTINLPSGLTIDFARIASSGTDDRPNYGTATHNDGTTDRILGSIVTTVADDDTVSVRYAQQNANTDTLINRSINIANASNPFTWGSGDTIYIRIEDLPIEEWAAPTYVSPGSQCEYAYTTGAWDGDSSATAYGMTGQALAGSLGAARTKTITWTRPAKFVRVLGSYLGGQWVDINSSRLGTTGSTEVRKILSNDGSFASGVSWREGTTARETIVTFQRYISLENDDGLVNWPSSGYWLVENCPTANGSIVYSLATETSSGLISSEASGTCTPTLTGSGGAFSSVTYVTQDCRWTRLGNRIFADVNVVWSAATGGTGNLRIAGLPTGANVSSSPRCATNFSRIDLSAGYGYVYTTFNGTSGEIGVAEAGDNVVAQSLGVAAATGGSFNKTLGASCNYEVNL